MLRYRRRARDADVVHLPVADACRGSTVPAAAPPARADRPRPAPARAAARPARGPAAAVRARRRGHRALAIRRAQPDRWPRVDPEKVHVIHHGAFEYLAHLPSERPLPAGAAFGQGPVVLFFGLLRPYKGLDVLLDAWRGSTAASCGSSGVRGWTSPRCGARRLTASGGCRGSSPTSELPAFFRRADIVVLPYTATERFDQSGVLATALALRQGDVLSDIGGFSERRRDRRRCARAARRRGRAARRSSSG